MSEAAAYVETHASARRGLSVAQLELVLLVFSHIDERLRWLCSDNWPAKTQTIRACETRGLLEWSVHELEGVPDTWVHVLELSPAGRAVAAAYGHGHDRGFTRDP